VDFTATSETNQRSSCRTRRPASRTGRNDTSLEVCFPYSVFPARSSGIMDGLATARPPAPPGFLNLLTLLSAPDLPALFHAGPALGVTPFRALLLSRSRTLSPAPLPSCCHFRASSLRIEPVWRFRPEGPKQPRSARPMKCLHSQPNFKVLLHVKVRCAIRGFRPERVRGSLGILSSSGSSPLPRWSGSHQTLPSCDSTP